MVRPLLAQLQQITGLQTTYLTRVDWDAMEQQIRYSHNDGAGPRIDEGLSVPWEEILCRRTLMDGRTNLSDAGVTYPDNKAVAALDIHGFAAAPVFTEEGGLWGTICGASKARAELGETDMATLRLFARLIGEKLSQLETRQPAENVAVAEPRTASV